jgi:DNA-directed RNA polymerase specialized sigma24 family protein
MAGIDLQAHHTDVRRICLAFWGRRCVAAGIPPEDFVQEVMKQVLIRNQGTCPYDPIKSSLGHYIHMVCSCTWINSSKRHRRLEGPLDAITEDSPELASDPEVDQDYTDEVAALIDWLSSDPDWRAALAIQWLPRFVNGETDTEIGQTQYGAAKAKDVRRYLASETAKCFHLRDPTQSNIDLTDELNATFF